jgi:hypothetical protein
MKRMDTCFSESDTAPESDYPMHGMVALAKVPDTKALWSLPSTCPMMTSVRGAADER